MVMKNKKAKSVPEYGLGWEKVSVGHKKAPPWSKTGQ